MNRHAHIALLVVALLAGGSTAEASRDRTASKGAGCDQPGPYPLPQADEAVQLDPADFTTRIDNPYWPMRPGTVWHYVEKGGGERATVTVTVTRRTKVIEGVRARVVHDVVRNEAGEIEENTWDWFAQDSGGSVWYLGEFTQEYEGGVPVNSEGSFQHGRNGAQAGVVVPAEPEVGCAYREEYLDGEAEDQAKVLSTTETVQTRFGLRHRVLQTANTTPLEPDILENKFYVRGLGPVLELNVSPSLGTAELVRVEHRARVPR